MPDIKVLNPHAKRGGFKHAIFDFDGTISLVRAGWQDVMNPYFIDVLAATPNPGSKKSITDCVRDFVDYNTGKQTIYQCIELAGEVKKRGGHPLEPIEYKETYHALLLERIDHRLEGLRSKTLSLADCVVPGSFELLGAMRDRGVMCYLASGTDEKYVLHEAALVGVTDYFDGGIYGAQDDYKNFSKKMVIENIIKENDLHGDELIGFGDGYVEIENVKEAGGFAVGVASDETGEGRLDEWKYRRLEKAGADIIIPHFLETEELIKYLFEE
ncbi:MAG: HAD family hydrolase [Clostridia bacterium]|jgi:phosphoglycolate phosphatase|nr:HAD family hydrolase [Clostridia bacterium]MBT7121825.1 HAD family hydrolase [Clostridia bacterium]